MSLEGGDGSSRSFFDNKGSNSTVLFKRGDSHASDSVKRSELTPDQRFRYDQNRIEQQRVAREERLVKLRDERNHKIRIDENKIEQYRLERLEKRRIKLDKLREEAENLVRSQRERLAKSVEYESNQLGSRPNDAIPSTLPYKLSVLDNVRCRVL